MTKPRIEIPALKVGACMDSATISKETKIRALEAQLKFMEDKSDDLVINKSATSERPLIHKYQYNTQGQPSSSSTTATKSLVKLHHKSRHKLSNNKKMY